MSAPSLPQPVAYADKLVWSNIFFVLNALAYLYVGYWFLALLMLLTSIASFQYHRTLEEKAGKTDQICAVITLKLILTTAYLHLETPYFAFLLSTALLSVVIKKWGDLHRGKDSYNNRHFIWHVIVFLSNLLAAVFFGISL